MPRESHDLIQLRPEKAVGGVAAGSRRSGLLYGPRRSTQSRKATTGRACGATAAGRAETAWGPVCCDPGGEGAPRGRAESGGRRVSRKLGRSRTGSAATLPSMSTASRRKGHRATSRTPKAGSSRLLRKGCGQSYSAATAWEREGVTARGRQRR